MSVDSREIERPRGLPRTFLHLTGIIVMTFITSLIVGPIVVLPSIIGYLFLTAEATPNLALALYGVIIAGGIVGVKKTHDQLYQPSDISFGDLLEEMDRKKAQRLMLMVVLMILYMNIAFGGTLYVMSVYPNSAILLGLLLPSIDRTMIVKFGYSPAFLPVFLVAMFIESTGVVRDINLDIVRDLNPIILDQSI